MKKNIENALIDFINALADFIDWLRIQVDKLEEEQREKRERKG